MSLLLVTSSCCGVLSFFLAVANIFTNDGLLAPHLNPHPWDPGTYFICSIPFDLSGLGGHTRVTGSHKPSTITPRVLYEYPKGGGANDNHRYDEGISFFYFCYYFLIILEWNLKNYMGKQDKVSSLILESDENILVWSRSSNTIPEC